MRIRSILMCVLAIAVMAGIHFMNEISQLTKKLEYQQQLNKYEYSMNIDDEGYTLYDWDREVGFIPYGAFPTLDTIMLNSNL